VVKLPLPKTMFWNNIGPDALQSHHKFKWKVSCSFFISKKYPQLQLFFQFTGVKGGGGGGGECCQFRVHPNKNSIQTEK
jgi:hypothetical protein